MSVTEYIAIRTRRGCAVRGNDPRAVPNACTFLLVQASSSLGSGGPVRSPSSTIRSTRRSSSSTRSSFMVPGNPRTVLTVRHGHLQMPISGEEFESWCWRNGGETYEDPPAGLGIVCRFPDADTPDRVAYLPDVGGFQVHTPGDVPFCDFAPPTHRFLDRRGRSIAYRHGRRPGGHRSTTGREFQRIDGTPMPPVVGPERGRE